MAQPKSTPEPTSYKYFKSLIVVNGAIAGYFCPESNDEDASYVAFVVAPQGIAVNLSGYSNPPAPIMRETVEVMRELVARFDALQQDDDSAADAS